MAKLSRLLGMAAKAVEKHLASESGDSSARQGAVPAPRPTQHRPYSPAPAHSSSRDGYAPPPPVGAARAAGASAVSDADRAAIARYDYLLQTADPHRVEQMHREAFERLTPAQRAQVQERMQAELTPGERPSSASAHDLARAAGRTEAARPGRMRALLSRVRGGRAGGGIGGAAVGGAAVGLLGAVAGGAVLSSVAGPLLEQAAGLGVDFDALAQGLDVDSLLQGLDVESLAGGFDAEHITGAAEGVLGSAGEAVSGFGETASGWGEKLGDLGIPGIRDLFGK
ncbi:hypothetical protein [Microbacterium oxydans]|uniref:Cation-transporting ATPase n=1 Tax=Microbacterium oxydans TaxID=82380 RepID=A0A0F0L5W8_9MICO|nr:hypothetical protein [Microbacterium oxydans]KJL28548.1 hypothetical protein RS83_03623 [Microbacterium oxydans]